MSAPQVYQIAGLLDHLVDAIDTARDLAAGDTRWTNAINAAADYLLQVETVEYDAEKHEITMPSASEPGVIRKANGVCSCKAFQNGHACLHRSAARLMRRALELRAQRAASAARRAGLEPLHEVEALADEIFANATEGTWLDARQEAEAQMPTLLAFASEYNAGAALGARLARVRAAEIAAGALFS